MRFISASQPFAGAPFNMVPAQHDFRIPSEEYLIMVQRRLGLPLTALRGIEHSEAMAADLDALGDTMLAAQDHTRRHNGVAAAFARAARQALPCKVLVDTFTHEHFSPGARPDVAVLRGAVDRSHHDLLEVKVLSPTSTTGAGTEAAGSHVAFGNTRADITRTILGCPPIGGRAAVPAKYAGALEKGHTVVPVVP